MNPDVVPPKWMLRLLHAVCPAPLAEEIEGDLLQKFQRDVNTVGSARARRRLALGIAGYLHPEIIFRHRLSPIVNPFDMILNYVKMAWRTLASGKFYSALNLAGLTLGLAVGLLILLWTNNELQFDSFHRRKDQLYQMSIHLQTNGEKFAASVVQAPIAPLAIREVPGIENAVRVTTHNHYAFFRYGEISLKDNVMVYTDPSLFTMFDYPLLQGNAAKPFPDPYAVILTESAARRYFGDANPMGLVLQADNEVNFTVSGVIADFPENGWIHCDMLFSTTLCEQRNIKNGWGSIDEDWGNYGWSVFLQVQPGVSVKSLEEKLSSINYKHQPGMKPVDAGAYGLQPLTDLHLHGPDGAPTGIKTVNMFLLIAALILLIAAINYVNLFTARAVLRAKEVSVRKIVGGTRLQLFLQFVVQTIVFFSLALIFAFGIIVLAMPLYNNLSGTHLRFNLLDATLWKAIGLTLLLTLTASSIYPAMLLSSFHPVKALKGKLSWGIGSTVFRKVLVVGQFSFSIGLIICTLIMNRQLQFLEHKDLGYDKTRMFSVNMDKMEAHYESARTELLSDPAIAGISSANGTIFQRWGATLDVAWDGKDPNQSFFMHDMKIDESFIPLLKMQLITGTNFTGAAADSTHFILNETAVRETGIKDPVGKRFRWHRYEGTIIAVVKDFNFVWAKQRIEPFVFAWKPSNEQLYVKTAGTDARAALDAVQKIWSRYNPGSPFDYRFTDEAYRKQFQDDERTSQLFAWFTSIAIAISCMGLLGLAAYAAQLRVREIGIRKVLGANAAGMAVMLSASFLVLILIAIALAVPAAWYIMHEWMTGFAYQTTMPVWIFAVSGLAAVLIAMVTIGFQSVRAALENPVKALKSE